MADRELFDLSRHVAVVTGGTSGIGRGIADALASAGADVAIWGRDEARGRAAQEELSRGGARVVAVGCDVSDAASVDAAFRRTLDELGRIDSCFANAGGVDLGPSFTDMSLDEFRAVVSVNLEGAFLTFQGAARHMIERGGGGSLVGISSLAAVEGMARGQHYAASKAGLIAMTRSLAVELARHGIRANAILPGWIGSSRRSTTACCRASRSGAGASPPTSPARRCTSPAARRPTTRATSWSSTAATGCSERCAPSR
jgi:NAD(P)-dependent dehydrogenase (short-subunit alcohol dehydrogenase family)